MRGSGRIFKRKNSRFWWIAYCHRGKEFPESSGSCDAKDAERLLKRRLKEIGADSLGLKAFVGPSQDRLRVGELLDALEADLKLRRVRSLAGIRSHLKQIRAAFGDRRAVEVRAETVDSYIEARLSEKEPPAPATVNRETGLLSQAFRLAVKRRQLSVAPEIRKLSERGNARQGFYEHAEFENLVKELPGYLQDFARFGYLTGWRKGEIKSLVWTNLDVEARVIRLRGLDSKNGEPRKVPLEGELWDIIERRWNARTYEKSNETVGVSLYVFHQDGRPIGDFRKAWDSACKKAELPGKLFHDFRRTAARNMRRAGVPEKLCMEITGHKTRAMFDRYNITDERDLREAMQKTQQYLQTVQSERKLIPMRKTGTGDSE